LYRSNLRVAEAIEQLTERLPDQPELGILVEFLGRSGRGIVR
jgi:acyl-[acyl carrier protein]--UDP-N-acetylglucosamine O-acyltransferase